MSLAEKAITAGGRGLIELAADGLRIFRQLALEALALRGWALGVAVLRHPLLQVFGLLGAELGNYPLQRSGLDA